MQKHPKVATLNIYLSLQAKMSLVELLYKRCMGNDAADTYLLTQEHTFLILEILVEEF